jgi:6-phosphogluconolactonase
MTAEFKNYMTQYCMKLCLLAFTVAGMLSAVKTFGSPDQRQLVFVGSGHKNISAFWLNMTSGALTPVGEVAEVAAPSFITISAAQRLYAVSEGRDESSSFVSAYRIDSETGKLTFLNRQPSGGAGPCHVAVDYDSDRRGMNVLAANYGSGSVSVFHLTKEGGLGPMSAFVQDHGSSVNPERQEGPHAHCIVTAPDDRFAFVCDLGLDKIMLFKFDASAGTLVANDPPFVSVKPGEGPRHITFHPNGRFAYVINEMAATITAFAYDSGAGVLREIEDQPLLAKDFHGKNTAAEVAVHPSGKFVYASNRGEDSIVVFGCDPDTGKLTFIERDSCRGKTPRNFEIDPTGNFLLAANQNSGTIVVFRIDVNTGRLQETGNKAESDTPMCVKFLDLAKEAR